MLLQLLLSAVAILVAWTVLDTVMHRLLLQPFYAENTSLVSEAPVAVVKKQLPVDSMASERRPTRAVIRLLCAKDRALLVPPRAAL